MGLALQCGFVAGPVLSSSSTAVLGLVAIFGRLVSNRYTKPAHYAPPKENHGEIAVSFVAQKPDTLFKVLPRDGVRERWRSAAAEAISANCCNAMPTMSRHI